MGNHGNGIASTILKTIVALLGVYIVAINITLWATSMNVGSAQLDEATYGWWTFNSFHAYRMKDFGYVGFRQFFDVLSTFPGLQATQGFTSTYLDIVSNYTLTNIGLFDAVIAIFRVISAPFFLSITIVVDILNNVVWFLGFLNIVPNTPQSTFLG